MFHIMLRQRLDGEVALDRDEGNVSAVSTKKNKNKRDAEAAELDHAIAKEIKFSRRAVQSFNLAALQDRVDELEDRLQEAVDIKDDLMDSGHYSDAVMRRYERKIETCKRRYEERLEAYEMQKNEMK